MFVQQGGERVSDDEFAERIVEIIKDKLSLEELESLVIEYEKQ